MSVSNVRQIAELRQRAKGLRQRMAWASGTKRVALLQELEAVEQKIMEMEAD